MKSYKQEDAILGYSLNNVVCKGSVFCFMSQCFVQIIMLYFFIYIFVHNIYIQ